MGEGLEPQKGRSSEPESGRSRRTRYVVSVLLLIILVLCSIRIIAACRSVRTPADVVLWKNTSAVHEIPDKAPDAGFREIEANFCAKVPLSVLQEAIGPGLSSLGHSQ